MLFPDSWEDLESRSPLNVPRKSVGWGTIWWALLSRSFQGSGLVLLEGSELGEDRAHRRVSIVSFDMIL